jgi:hypothetical protein
LKDIAKFKPKVNFKASQNWLKGVVAELFPSTEIYEDYIHPGLTFSSNKPMQLDIFLPSLHLAFEYQGIQHYQEKYYFGNSLRSYLYAIE